MRMIFTDDEYKYLIYLKPYGRKISDNCPPEIRKTLEDKLSKMNDDARLLDEAQEKYYEMFGDYFPTMVSIYTPIDEMVERIMQHVNSGVKFERLKDVLH